MDNVEKCTPSKGLGEVWSKQVGTQIAMGVMYGVNREVNRI